MSPPTAWQVHCNEQAGCEELTWMENGFLQCFAEVERKRAANRRKSGKAREFTEE